MKPTLITASFAVCCLLAGIVHAGPGGRYVVKPGDSIAEIARHHGVDQQQLRELNGLEEDQFIHPGDELAIPEVLLEGWTLKKKANLFRSVFGRRIQLRYLGEEQTEVSS